jgi:thioredoxin reductase
MDELKECGVTMLSGKKVIEVTDKGAVVDNTVSRETQLIQAKQVVLALGAEPVQSLAEALEGIVGELYLIGDCQEPQTILKAVSDGFLIGYRI